jgi:hypothetical protein
MWNALAKCKAFMTIPLRISKDRDITAANFKAATQLAKELGLCDPGDDQVKCWIIALMHPRTHYPEQAVRSFLAVEFGDSLAIFIAALLRIRKFHICPTISHWCQRLQYMELVSSLPPQEKSCCSSLQREIGSQIQNKLHLTLLALAELLVQQPQQPELLQKLFTPPTMGTTTRGFTSAME